jgi:thiosulfate reductase cytochrome b subunit
MLESAYLPELTMDDSEPVDRSRHSLLVRMTHWITTLSFVGLLVSGIAILLAHPRLYWGETGGLDGPSLVDLPLPFVFGPSGWGRSLHFLAAWISVATGVAYVLSGILTQHFRMHLLPAEGDLSWSSISRVVSNHLRLKRPTPAESLTYNVLQRLTYLVVIFVLFPLMIWTGLAMSPAITSVAPALVTVLGGQQSARTIHFAGMVALVLFVLVHITMVCLAGFSKRMRAMITGHSPAEART